MPILQIELPEDLYREYEGRRMYLFAGIDLIAYKHPKNDKWYPKIAACTMCGECCRQCDDRWIYPHVDGVCVHLKEMNENQFLCDLGINRPFACGFPVWHHGIPKCTEQFDNEDDPHKITK